MQQPTRAHGWIHQMTCLRELSWRHGTLYQNPVRELAALRGEAQGWQTEPLALQPMELAFEVAPDDALTLDFAGVLQLSLDRHGVRLARRSLVADTVDYRYWRGTAHKLQILIDRSSVEIFINDGVGVMSSRFFADYLENWYSAVRRRGHSAAGRCGHAW